MLTALVLSSDSSAALTKLLRYPSPRPHPPVSFVQDGLYLEQNPTPERGAFIISKYSGKPPESSKMPAKMSDVTGRARPARKFQFRHGLRDNSDPNSIARLPAKDSPLSFEGFFQDVSEGIQRRTETWGVTKAVRGAVNEAKKNMQSMQPEQASRLLRPGESNPVHASGPAVDRESEVTSALKAKIESIWEKNQSLARTLGEAVNDMRSLTKREDFGVDTKKSFEQALTKVESVQADLEALKLANATSSSKVEDTVSKAKHANQSTTGERRFSTSDSDKLARSYIDSSGANIPKSPGEGESEKHGALPSKPVNKTKPPRNPTRPSLANSEFSWMLGGDRQLSSFVSPVSVPPEQSRHEESRAKNGALFGNADGEQRPNAQPDGMVMRSLRGVKRPE